VQLRQKEAYQSLIGSIGWLSSTTCPDLAAAHFFLSSYTNKPASGHMKATLYVLHYIHSTHDLGSFSPPKTLLQCTPMFILLPPPMPRHTTMQFLQNWVYSTPFLPIVMLVGAPNLAALLPMALFSPCSNSKV
jgi:hypothetical protein